MSAQRAAEAEIGAALAAAVVLCVACSCSVLVRLGCAAVRAACAVPVVRRVRSLRCAVREHIGRIGYRVEQSWCEHHHHHHRIMHHRVWKWEVGQKSRTRYTNNQHLPMYYSVTVQHCVL